MFNFDRQVIANQVMIKISGDFSYKMNLDEPINNHNQKSGNNKSMCAFSNEIEIVEGVKIP
jgi:propanediol utilization protein